MKKSIKTCYIPSLSNGSYNIIIVNNSKCMRKGIAIKSFASNPSVVLEIVSEIKYLAIMRK